MTNITESTGPPSGPLPRKGDWQTRIRNMRTHHAAPQGLDPYGRSARNFVKRKRSRYSGLPAPQGQLSATRLGVPVQNAEQ